MVSGWGRELKNLGPLPFQGSSQKKFPESENFFQKMLATGWEGLGRRFVSENKTFQKYFQTLFLRTGGLNLVFQTFFDLNFLENSLIFNTFRNSSIPGPPLLFTIIWGYYIPHPTPPPVVPSLLIRQFLLQAEQTRHFHRLSHR